MIINLIGETNFVKTLNVSKNYIECKCNLMWLLASTPFNLKVLQSTMIKPKKIICNPPMRKHKPKNNKEGEMEKEQNKLTLKELLSTSNVKSLLHKYMKSKCNST